MQTQNNWQESVGKVNEDLQNLLDISIAHNLRLNPTKSQSIVFGPKHKRLEAEGLLQIKLGQDLLPIVTECKNLGLWLDSNLRFHKHVNSLCQSSYNILRQLYQSRDIMSPKLKLKLCETLILSKLSYCDIIYGFALIQDDVKRLQKIQNNCIRLSYGIRKYDHVSAGFEEAGWLRLEKIWKLHLLVNTHKIIVKKMPDYLHLRFTTFKSQSNSRTRNQNTFVIPKHSSAGFTRSFMYNSIKHYNSLPSDFKHFTILNFKKKLKEHLRFAG